MQLPVGVRDGLLVNPLDIERYAAETSFRTLEHSLLSLTSWFLSQSFSGSHGLSHK